MKGVGGTLIAAVLLCLASACGAVPGTGGPTPRASSTPSTDPITAAWRKCGATRVPPKKVLDAQVPGSTQVLWTPDIPTAEASRVVKAWGHTDALLNWAVHNNELTFLQGTCVAAPLSHTEDADIKIIRAAEKAGGHAVFDPDPKPVKIAIRPVPAALADTIQSRISSRPTVAIIVIAPGTTVWINDHNGRHIKKYAESDVNTLYINVTLGSIVSDDVGERFWQQAEYACTNPEAAGICDGL